MNLTDVKTLYRDKEQFIDKEVTVGGWVRSNRDSKNFGFLVINDGTFRAGKTAAGATDDRMFAGTLGALTIKGGTIFGGKATTGGNIYAINATVSIPNDNNDKTAEPQIMSGSATTGSGGNIAIGNSAKLTMDVGTVTSGTAASGNGGNIAAAGDSGKKAECNLNAGVTVSNGTASKGGNLYATYATINIDGAQILGGEKPLEGRYADTLAPIVEPTREKLQGIARSDEDVLSYIAFPNLAEKFLEDRKAKEENIVTYSIVEA